VIHLVTQAIFVNKNSKFFLCLDVNKDLDKKSNGKSI